MWMKDTLYVLKWGSYLFADEKSVRDCVMPFITNNLFDSKLLHASRNAKTKYFIVSFCNFFIAATKNRITMRPS